VSQPPSASPEGSGRPRVGAVVVNHNAGPALLECVASLRRAGIDDVVVVDNASCDGSLEALALADAAVVLLPTGKNLGYGKAANLGVARLDEELILICNPDLVVEPGACEHMVAALEHDGAVAVVGPLLLEPNGTCYPSARAFPSLGVGFLHAFVGLFWPQNPWSRRYRREDELALTQDPDWVSGACMLVRRTAFASVGGFDEGYFMYVEDLDLCWRLRRAGWAVCYEPAARVTHVQGASTRRHPYRMLLAHHRSAWRFARRSTRGLRRLVLPFVGAGLVVRAIVAASSLALRRHPASSGQ
jgi:N-acetylglucosaminyl-diphospho-decaprenol L-rhamnosyltransferase